jgi:DNA mismatch endonuclease (patch repair protein)
MRYTTHNRDLPGSPDLANRSRAWAVFVHGCYWHRHNGCSMATTPKANAQFWSAKFERNVERDRETRTALRRLGYRVLTLWQCEAESSAKLSRRLVPFARSLGYTTSDRDR